MKRFILVLINVPLMWLCVYLASYSIGYAIRVFTGDSSLFDLICRVILVGLVALCLFGYSFVGQYVLLVKSLLALLFKPTGKMLSLFALLIAAASCAVFTWYLYSQVIVPYIPIGA